MCRWRGGVRVRLALHLAIAAHRVLQLRLQLAAVQFLCRKDLLLAQQLGVLFLDAAGQLLRDRRAGQPFTEAVRDRILDLCAEHDGLSLSGGDPLFPANRTAVADLCRRFKQRYPDKDIWLWTGYRHEEVQHLPLLQDVDVLIDGPYLKDLPTTKPWRGSDNQRLIRLASGETT